ncbi:hypothetical protein [Haloarcula japonica]|uniref:hypothetical protein n=1 Tax=Haloarcula japonica TaxID=29282 RepID=UPI000B317BEB|nr:hypothetical protein [Haloarcula japonica]
MYHDGRRSVLLQRPGAIQSVPRDTEHIADAKAKLPDGQYTSKWVQRLCQKRSYRRNTP